MKRKLISLFVFGMLIPSLASFAAEPVADYQLGEGDELHLCIHHTADFSYSVFPAPGGERFTPSAIDAGISPLKPGSELGVLPNNDNPGVGMIFQNKTGAVETQNTRFFAVLAAPVLRDLFNQDPHSRPAPYVVVKGDGDPNPPCYEGQSIPETLRVFPADNVTAMKVSQVITLPEAVEDPPEADEPRLDPNPIVDPISAQPASGGCSLEKGTSAVDFSSAVLGILTLGLASGFLIYAARRKN